MTALLERIAKAVSKYDEAEHPRGPDGRWIHLLGKLETAQAEHKAATDTSLDYINLRGVRERGDTPRGGWISKIESGKVPSHPTQEQVDEKSAVTRRANEKLNAVRAEVHEEAVKRRELFEVKKREDLKTKPYEVVPHRNYASSLGTQGFREHGAQVRLGRYKTQDAAQRTVDELHDKEAARLGLTAQTDRSKPLSEPVASTDTLPRTPPGRDYLEKGDPVVVIGDGKVEYEGVQDGVVRAGVHNIRLPNGSRVGAKSERVAHRDSPRAKAAQTASSPDPEGKDFRDMTDAEKARAGEIITGKPQPTGAVDDRLKTQRIKNRTREIAKRQKAVEVAFEDYVGHGGGKMPTISELDAKLAGLEEPAGYLTAMRTALVRLRDEERRLEAER